MYSKSNIQNKRYGREPIKYSEFQRKEKESNRPNAENVSHRTFKNATQITNENIQESYTVRNNNIKSGNHNNSNNNNKNRMVGNFKNSRIMYSKETAKYERSHEGRRDRSNASSSISSNYSRDKNHVPYYNKPPVITTKTKNKETYKNANERNPLRTITGQSTFWSTSKNEHGRKEENIKCQPSYHHNNDWRNKRNTEESNNERKKRGNNTLPTHQLNEQVRNKRDYKENNLGKVLNNRRSVPKENSMNILKQTHMKEGMAFSTERKQDEYRNKMIEKKEEEEEEKEQENKYIIHVHNNDSYSNSSISTHITTNLKTIMNTQDNVMEDITENEVESKKNNEEKLRSTSFLTNRTTQHRKLSLSNSYNYLPKNNVLNASCNSSIISDSDNNELFEKEFENDIIMTKSPSCQDHVPSKYSTEERNTSSDKLSYKTNPSMRSSYSKEGSIIEEETKRLIPNALLRHNRESVQKGITFEEMKRKSCDVSTHTINNKKDPLTQYNQNYHKTRGTSNSVKSKAGMFPPKNFYTPGKKKSFPSNHTKEYTYVGKRKDLTDQKYKTYQKEIKSVPLVDENKYQEKEYANRVFSMNEKNQCTQDKSNHKTNKNMKINEIDKPFIISNESDADFSKNLNKTSIPIYENKKIMNKHNVFNKGFKYEKGKPIPEKEKFPPRNTCTNRNYGTLTNRKDQTEPGRIPSYLKKNIIHNKGIPNSIRTNRIKVSSIRPSQSLQKEQAQTSNFTDDRNNWKNKKSTHKIIRKNATERQSHSISNITQNYYKNKEDNSINKYKMNNNSLDKNLSNVMLKDSSEGTCSTKILGKRKNNNSFDISYTNKRIELDNNKNENNLHLYNTYITDDASKEESSLKTKHFSLELEQAKTKLKREGGNLTEKNICKMNEKKNSLYEESELAINKSSLHICQSKEIIPNSIESNANNEKKTEWKHNIQTEQKELFEKEPSSEKDCNSFSTISKIDKKQIDRANEEKEEKKKFNNQNSYLSFEIKKNTESSMISTNSEKYTNNQSYSNKDKTVNSYSISSFKTNNFIMENNNTPIKQNISHDNLPNVSSMKSSISQDFINNMMSNHSISINENPGGFNQVFINELSKEDSILQTNKERNQTKIEKDIDNHQDITDPNITDKENICTSKESVLYKSNETNGSTINTEIKKIAIHNVWIKPDNPVCMKNLNQQDYSENANGTNVLTCEDSTPSILPKCYVNQYNEISNITKVDSCTNNDPEQKNHETEEIQYSEETNAHLNKNKEDSSSCSISEMQNFINKNKKLINETNNYFDETKIETKKENKIEIEEKHFFSNGCNAFYEKNYYLQSSNGTNNEMQLTNLHLLTNVHNKNNTDQKQDKIKNNHLIINNTEVLENKLLNNLINHSSDVQVENFVHIKEMHPKKKNNKNHSNEYNHCTFSSDYEDLIHFDISDIKNEPIQNNELEIKHTNSSLHENKPIHETNMNIPNAETETESPNWLVTNSSVYDFGCGRETPSPHVHSFNNENSVSHLMQELQKVKTQRSQEIKSDELLDSSCVADSNHINSSSLGMNLLGYNAQASSITGKDSYDSYNKKNTIAKYSEQDLLNFLKNTIKDGRTNNGYNSKNHSLFLSNTHTSKQCEEWKEGNKWNSMTPGLTNVISELGLAQQEKTQVPNFQSFHTKESIMNCLTAQLLPNSGSELLKPSSKNIIEKEECVLPAYETLQQNMHLCNESEIPQKDRETNLVDWEEAFKKYLDVRRNDSGKTIDRYTIYKEFTKIIKSLISESKQNDVHFHRIHTKFVNYLNDNVDRTLETETLNETERVPKGKQDLLLEESSSGPLSTYIGQRSTTNESISLSVNENTSTEEKVQDAQTVGTQNEMSSYIQREEIEGMKKRRTNVEEDIVMTSDSTTKILSMEDTIEDSLMKLNGLHKKEKQNQIFYSDEEKMINNEDENIRKNDGKEKVNEHKNIKKIEKEVKEILSKIEVQTDINRMQKEVEEISKKVKEVQMVQSKKKEEKEDNHNINLQEPVQRTVSYLHHVEAEKLNSDIPYITDVHTEMYRSPVMPLRIEAFHSLEDKRLIYGNPDWQKFYCPLCDKKCYPPNTYSQNYKHYVKEHWETRHVIGGYVLFECKLNHDPTQKEDELNNKKNKKTKSGRKKPKKIHVDSHVHCPLCINLTFQNFEEVVKHCSKEHKDTAADPNRCLPSKYVYTPFMNNEDFFTQLKKVDSEINVKESDVDEPNKQSQEEKEKNENYQNDEQSEEHQTNGTLIIHKSKKARKSKVNFCEQIKVREYDIELSKVEKVGATMGPVFTEEENEEKNKEKENEEKNDEKNKDLTNFQKENNENNKIVILDSQDNQSSNSCNNNISKGDLVIPFSVKFTFEEGSTLANLNDTEVHYNLIAKPETCQEVLEYHRRQNELNVPFLPEHDIRKHNCKHFIVHKSILSKCKKAINKSKERETKKSVDNCFSFINFQPIDKDLYIPESNTPFFKLTEKDVNESDHFKDSKESELKKVIREKKKEKIPVRKNKKEHKQTRQSNRLKSKKNCTETTE